MKPFLSPIERSELKTLHRKERNRRNADRIKAVLLADEGWPFKTIAQALFLDEETISKHVGEYLDRKKLKGEGKGSETKLNKVQTDLLISHLEQHTYLKVMDICAYVEAEYGIRYTVSGMTYWLQAHKFSFHEPAPVPAKADPIKQAAFIEYYEHLKKATPEEEPILFLDAVHPTMATKITRGWIRRGVKKPIETTGSRTRVNLVGAINLVTMDILSEKFDTINSESMAQFFDTVKKAHPKAPKIHIILDNGSYNKSEVTREAAQTRGIVLHYLPPYSPNLNSIERLWRVMNEDVRNGVFFKSAKEFRREIMRFFEETWPAKQHDMVDTINDTFQRLKQPKKSTI